MKGRLVRRVRRRLLELDDVQRQPESIRLRLQQRASHTVNADPIVTASHAREQSDDLVTRIVAEGMQSQGAVLSAAPAEQ